MNSTDLGPYRQLVGNCLVCDERNRTKATLTLTINDNASAHHWVCGLCQPLAQRPRVAGALQICALTGIKYRDVVRLFARAGIEPPASAAEVPAALRAIARANP